MSESPLVGAGIYANDANCAVVATGTGEHFVRASFALDIHARMTCLHESVEAACEAAVQGSLQALGGRGGAVVVDRRGHIAMPFNSFGMYRCWVTSGAHLMLKVRTSVSDSTLDQDHAVAERQVRGPCWQAA